MTINKNRNEIAAKFAGFEDLNAAEYEKIEEIFKNLSVDSCVQDVLGERAYQIFRWDESNASHLNSIDEYIGLCITYLGGATCSYRNSDNDKREYLVKAAAILLQTINHIDNKRI